MPFAPIAVVGRGCVLPGALDPDGLWQVVTGRWLVTGPPPHPGRHDPAALLGNGDGPPCPGTAGYVRGFANVFDPAGFALDPDRLSGLDPVFLWTLHCARQALREAGLTGPQPRAGLVLGNLAYPTAGLTRFAEHVWARNLPAEARGAAGPGGPPPDPRNRFAHGLAAHLTATALGLGAGAFSLDAACATSLYAVKLAADRLHDGSADLMLAAAVNASDMLYLRSGFRAIQALSPTGRSRPFHQDADGLVPAEGAACVALMRLADAEKAELPILGVIRGIGLSNDGRAGGLLAPDEHGQEKAMRRAYRSAGLDPATVSLLECHATGTTVGDAVEVRSTARVFGDREDLPIGSLKSNLGHSLTVAGLAGLLKVLGALEHGTRPASLADGALTGALEGTPLRVLTADEPWEEPRRAAVSTFGFGGNNAHLIVEEWEAATSAASPWTPPEPRPEPVAIVATGIRSGPRNGSGPFTGALLRGEPAAARCETVEVTTDGLAFPPKDLQQARGAQLLMLEAAREALAGRTLDGERTMLFIGCGSDVEVARYAARSHLVPDALPADRAAAMRDAFVPPLSPPGVVGEMASLIANRLNVQWNLTGPGHIVFAEEASGLTALALGRRALREGEADTVLVGAVDLSDEPVHQEALRELGLDRAPGDAAVALLLRRHRDAVADGDEIIAVLDERPDGAPGLRVAAPGGAPEPSPARAVSLEELTGCPHAAQGLLGVAVAALALRHRAVPLPGEPAVPLLGPRSAEVVVEPLGAPATTTTLRAAAPVPAFRSRPPRLHVHSGRDAREAAAAARRGRESADGPARLVIAAATPDELAERRAAAADWLDGRAARPRGVAFRAAPLEGRTAFVYTNGAAAYPRMGRDLMLAFPDLMDGIREASGPIDEFAGWAYGGPSTTGGRALEQIWAAGLLARLHTALMREVLGVRPGAVVGYSSGESNALISLGLWEDIPGFMDRLRRADLFTRDVAGEHRVVRRLWEGSDAAGDRWANHMVPLPHERVRAALDGEAAVYLMTVNSPLSCVIGGAERACARVLARLGATRTAIPVDYDIAVHAPVVQAVAADWRRVHDWPLRPLDGVPFYSAGTSGPYLPTRETAADALTAMAMDTVDFPSMIERAWADGVRVFIEHGPRGWCSRWISETLGEREHLAVPLDGGGGDGVASFVQAVAELVAAGLPVDLDALVGGWDAAEAAPPARRRSLPVPAHPRPIAFPDRPPHDDAHEATPLRLPPAPALPLDIGPDPCAPPAVSGRLVHAPAKNEGRRHPLGEVHNAFLAGQTQVQTRFLAYRQHALRLLLDGAPPTAPFPLTPARQPRPPQEPPPATTFPGPSFDRSDLERLASGPISELFGPRFAAQDGHHRQTRMPMPPMLIADRVLGIDAEPCSMGTGTIWTQTDVDPGAWYLDHCGRVPPGVLVEGGQADLLLISWLGVDLLTRGERVYRLLGCELTFHDVPPAAGETLTYEIGIDGHGEHDGRRLFFFHSDCRSGDRPKLSVRHGQAGYFTDDELAEAGGVLWDPADEPSPDDLRLDPPAVPDAPRRYGPDAVRAFAEGRAADCFGPGWDLARSHVRSPRIGQGRMLLLDEVTDFDPAGGPWGRGYLRAELPIAPDDWFFEGHFKNDPCMPGTLMLEGCFQAMGFFMAALGHTLHHDGWRFEPVPEEPYAMRCRGQAVPTSRKLVYEVFAAEVVAGPVPTLRADVLCTVDGVKAFHARRLGLRLAPDWPLDHWGALAAPRVQQDGAALEPADLGGLAGHRDPEEVAVLDGVPLGYRAALAAAWGRPTAAFGPSYERFDGPRRCARLPGPPYLFVSRVTRVSGPPARMEPGAEVEIAYDLPPRAWFWDQNGSARLPFAVLMEICLQPCGWLATYVGSTLAVPHDLLFRNLDGTGAVHREVGPGTGTLRTRVKLTDLSRQGPMILLTFDIECRAADGPVFTGTTKFGFFPPEAFADQVGLPPDAEERARLEAPCDYAVDLRARPERLCAGPLRLPGPMLLMIDRVTGFWPDGGAAGLGRLRAEKDVDAGEWFFRSHFFQDPVQPGSLGVEAMAQLLRFYMIETGLGADVPHPGFEALPGREVVWKYRGQVTPANTRVIVELEVTEAGTGEHGPYAVADAWLWVDGLRIYHVRGLGLRVVPGTDGPAALRGPGVAEWTIGPDTDPWLRDHRPTWTVPTLPLMTVADRIAAAAGVPPDGRIRLRDVRMHDWALVPGPTRVRTETVRTGTSAEVTLALWQEGPSRFVPAAQGRVEPLPPGGRPNPFPPLADAGDQVDPYEEAFIFNGPAFHRVVELRLGSQGASGVVDPTLGRVPHATLGQGLLDAVTHMIPHARLQLWCARIPAGTVALPHRIERLDLHEALPIDRPIQVEVRFAGLHDGDLRYPVFDCQMLVEGRVAAELRLVEVLLPLGPLAHEITRLRVFMGERRYADGIGVSATDGAATTLTRKDAAACDWLPGTVRDLYGLGPGALTADALAAVAIRDHVGRRTRAHPRQVDLTGGPEKVRSATRPLTVHHLVVEHRGADAVTVRDGRPPSRDLGPVCDRLRLAAPDDRRPFVAELVATLPERFLGEFLLTDPDACRDRTCLFLLEQASPLDPLVFALTMTGLTGRPLATLQAHRTLFRMLTGVGSPFPDLGLDTFTRPVGGNGSVAAPVAARLDAGTGVALVRPPRRARGTEADLVALIDLARERDVPVVPVAFARSDLTAPIRRDHLVGEALSCDAPWPEGPQQWPPDRGHVQPDDAFVEKVRVWRRRHDVGSGDAALAVALSEARDPGPLGGALRAGGFDSGTPPWAAALLRRLLGAG
ncbi:beta-ketoacyl synthase N-terminal-like domain-containing protein [Spirillospora sp. NPDC050679]